MFGIIAGLTQDTLSDLNLAVHDGPDEVLVVDVTLAVLVAHEELLGLLVTQLFPEGGQQVPELRGADEPVPVLVKDSESLSQLFVTTRLLYLPG